MHYSNYSIFHHILLSSLLISFLHIFISKILSLTLIISKQLVFLLFTFSFFISNSLSSLFSFFLSSNLLSFLFYTSYITLIASFIIYFGILYSSFLSFFYFIFLHIEVIRAKHIAYISVLLLLLLLLLLL